MAFEAMDRAGEKGFDKFTQIAQHFYLVLKGAIDLRDDLKVFVLVHAENTGDALNPNFKIKTQGEHFAPNTSNSVNPKFYIIVKHGNTEPSSSLFYGRV